MKSFVAHPVVLLFLRLGLAALFLIACVDKILHPDRFIVAVDNYRFLPDVLVAPFALSLPWVELIVGICLVFGFWARPAALLSALMFLSFAVAVTAAVVRGFDINCGCFVTDGTEPVNYWYIIRDVGLFAASVWMVIAGPGKYSLDALLQKRAPGA